MNLKDWYELNVKQEYSETGIKGAVERGSVELVNGALRNTIAPYIGSPIWEEDFDILLVLDATRVDMMEEIGPEFGFNNIEAKWSNAACSLDWIKRNFKHTIPEDNVGYVTANPFSGHNEDYAQSADLVEGKDIEYLDEVWKYGWEETEGIITTPPDLVTERAIAAWRNREELNIDKLVVHYMQPHQPFRMGSDWGAAKRNLENLVTGDNNKDHACIWERTRYGDFTVDEVKSSYYDNLRWVLGNVTEVAMKNLDGDIHITADHGNAMGEWLQWGHPPDVITPEVRKVPYIRTEGIDKNTVQPEFSKPETEVDIDVEEQLEDLGYM